MQTSSKRGHPLEPAFAAISFVFRKAPILLWIGTPPALLSLIVTYAIHRVWIPGVLFEVTAPSQLPPSMAWVETIVAGICATLFAVGVHRLVLRHEVVSGIPVRLRRYELAYAVTLITFVGAEIVFALIAGAVASILPDRAAPQWMAVLIVVVAVIIIVGIWVHVRLALTFPHAALTGRIDPRPSWRAMQGNVYPFISGALMIGLLCAAVQLGFLIVFSKVDRYWSHAEWTAFAGTVLIVALWGLAIAMIIAFVSYTYQALVPFAGQSGGECLAPASAHPPERAQL
jgi:hypothetical protein